MTCSDKGFTAPFSETENHRITQYQNTFLFVRSEASAKKERRGSSVVVKLAYQGDEIILTWLVCYPLSVAVTTQV